ncbi:MAG: hypothetical protein P3X22_001425 [Thermoprotei archaeon]|nr:hypothetical protein [Thermoprotei archaeon]
MRYAYEYYRREDEKFELLTSTYQHVYELKEIIDSLLNEAMEAGMMGDYRTVFRILKGTKDAIDETIEILEIRRAKARRK